MLMTASAAAPDGFIRYPRTSPLFCRELDGAVQLGLRIAEPHCNGRGFAHGGLIASLADNAMGWAVTRASQVQGAVTVHLSLDYMRSVLRGQWLQFEPRVVRVGKSLGVVDALITADGETVARADATFWIAP